MTNEPSRDELAQLRTEFAAQRATLAAQGTRLAAQQARIAQLERRRRRPRRAIPLALVAALMALAALLPLGVRADYAFVDLNAGSPHNDNITAIRDAGITKGCNPPNFDQYCPNAYVTREEMASFLARTAGIGNNAPVTTAARLAPSGLGSSFVAYSANDLVRVSQQALTPQLAFINSSTDQIYGPMLTITVPYNGYIIVTTNVELAYKSGTCPCIATTSVQHYALSALQATSEPQSVSLDNTTSSIAVIPQTWVFRAIAGPNIFQVMVHKSSASGNTAVFNTIAGSATALYVAFDGTGQP